MTVSEHYQVQLVIDERCAIVGIGILQLRQESIVSRARDERRDDRRRNRRRARRRARAWRARHWRGGGNERRHENKIDAGANNQHDQKIECAIDKLLRATGGHGFIIDDFGNKKRHFDVGTSYFPRPKASIMG